jgi:hypothetical protein
MNISISVKYDQTDSLIPSTIILDDYYDNPTGAINITLQKGWYNILIETDEPWANVNSVDALLILKHFVQLNTLTGLKKSCADLDGNHAINSTDALMTMRRFVQLINNFPVGDWKFETSVVNQTINITLYGRCVGDVN